MMEMPEGRREGDASSAVQRDLMLKRARNWASRGVGGEGEQRVASKVESVGAPDDEEEEEAVASA